GGVDVEGTSTTEISGDLDLPGAIDQIIELTENPACSSQLEMAGPLPLGELERAKSELGKVVKNAHGAVYVGEEKVEIEFELTLGEVNEEQSISAPSNAKPLEQLFSQLGFNPLELFGR